MTQKEQMLRFIKGYDVVSEDALLNRFDLSFTATLKDLKAEGYVTQNTEYKSPGGMIVGRVPVYTPDTWHITPKGEVWLKDLETDRQLKLKADWWARGLAIAALLISLIAILEK